MRKIHWHGVLVVLIGLFALTAPEPGTGETLAIDICGTACGSGVYATCSYENIEEVCSQVCEEEPTGGLCAEDDDRCGGDAYYICTGDDPI